MSRAVRILKGPFALSIELMPKINFEILRWARETADISAEEAVSRLRFRDTRKRTGLERLMALEHGIDDPSRSLLIRIARLYHRPLLTFYMSNPPVKGDRGQDFRTLPEDHDPGSEALLDALLRSIQARQSLFRSAVLDEDESRYLAFVNSATMEQGVDALVESIRETLNLSDDRFRDAKDVDEAFQILRQAVEDSGIYVLLIGNLGSHHTNIDLETFRGFALADSVAPFIVINDLDHHGAWSFTLLHELTHLWLGQSGVSGGESERAIEIFCNDVASRFLMPSEKLEELRGVSGIGAAEAARLIREFAGAQKVSMSLVAYKLYRADIIDHDRWLKLSAQFREMWIEGRKEKRKKARSSSGGPNYYVVRRHRLGSALLTTTARFMHSGILTTTKAGRVLGVKAKNVQKLLVSGLKGAL